MQSSEPIAIIGIGCRFPGGADCPERFWELLISQRDAIVDIPPDRWDVSQFYDPDPAAPGKSFVRQGGFLEQPIDRFDAGFFGISPREAAALDPQQRVLLEVVWESFEDAGVDPDRLRGSPTGVYVGGFCLGNMIQQLGILNRNTIYDQTATSSTMVMLANRVSYLFDLRGPSVALDTACSSSLTAFHLACRAIGAGDCVVAVAAGTNIMLRPEYFIAMCKGGFLSPDARCKAFDSRANGYARGEGAGAVVLKSLSRARADGDPVYAVVRATGINQDGRSQGITVPNPEAQTALFDQVCRDAAIDPAEIRYVEAHGTGTQAGDPVEASSLGAILAPGRAPDAPCLIGSVKTNIGHLEAAAGVAGLIKAALCIHHRRVPGNLHFERVNPAIDLDALGLRVPTEPISLRDDAPLYVAVNSFGYGGANANAILASPESGRRRATVSASAVPPASSGEGTWIPVSARSEAALTASTGRLAGFVRDHRDVALGDLCHTLTTRRASHRYRAMFLASSAGELADDLAAHAAGEPAAAIAVGRSMARSDRSPVFVYTGMGTQWWHMGVELRRRHPVFRDALRECDEVVRDVAGYSLCQRFGWIDGEPVTSSAAGSPMSAPADAQPANLAMQIALTRLWRHLGVVPGAIVGHSVGEIAAAWSAGVLDIASAFKLAHHRSRLQQALVGQGTMLATGAPLSSLGRFIDQFPEALDIAAYNSRYATVLAGCPDALDVVAETLTGDGVFCRRLQVDVAYHSRQMDSIRGDFFARIAGIAPRPATVPLYSTVTGQRAIPGEQDAEYWWRNVRQRVQFRDAILAMGRDGHDAFVEVGPHPALGLAIMENAGEGGVRATVLPSLTRGKEAWSEVTRSFAGMFSAGYRIDWRAHAPAGRLVRVPGYPWQRERHWIESTASQNDRIGTREHPLLHARQVAPLPTWTTALGADHGYIADHRISDHVVVPGALFAETGVALAAALGRPRRVAALTFEKFLAGARATLEVRVSDDDHLTIYSRDGDSAWQRHASGRLSVTRLDPPGSLDVPGIAASLDHDVDPALLYGRLAARGLEYGPRFRTMERLRVGDGEALVEVVRRDAPGDDDEYWIHPTLLDGCFQALVALVGQDADGGSSLLVPISIRELSVHGRVGARAWAHLRVTERRPPGGDHGVDGDIVVCDDEGEILATVYGVRLSPVEQSSGRRRHEHGFFHQLWRPLPEIAEATVAPGRGPGRWLIISADDTMAAGIAQALDQASCEVVAASCGAAFERDEESFVVSPVSRADLMELAAAVAERPDASLEGIVYIPATAASGDGDCARDSASALLTIAQSFAPVTGDGSRRLVLVTRGLHAVYPDEQIHGLGGAAAFGLARVIGNEMPSYRVIAIDLAGGGASARRGASDVALGDDDYRAAVREMLHSDPEREMAWRGQTRHGHRVVPGAGSERAPSSPVSRETPCFLDVTRTGGIDSLVYLPTRRRDPGPGEVEIAVRVAPLNFKDLMKAMGMLGGDYLRKTFFGERLGVECAGVITAVGAGVTGFAVGDEVVSPDGQGCFRTFNTVPTRYLVPRPGPLSLAESVCFINYITAYHALVDIARLEPGETVLIHSAASGVGLAAVHLARRAGATIFATAGNDERRGYLRSLAVAHVMDSRSLEFAERIRSITGGRGVDVVINSLSGEALDRSMALLATYGRFVEIGKRDILAGRSMSLAILGRQATIAAIDIDRMMAERPARFRRVLDAVWQLLDDGSVPPLPVQTFAPVATRQAFQTMADAGHIGKLVIDYDDGAIPVQVGHPGDRGIASHATYLITGGFGGLGVALAHRLVRRGARHLVLVGRRGGTSQTARQTIAALEQAGAAVIARAVDVSQQSEVIALIAEIARTMPPLRGVFHTAAVLDDGMLHEQTHQRLARVWAAKAGGAYHLHRATAECDLDHFVLFSSIAAVIGNAGQAGYVAANHYLDCLAWYRRSRGLPAMSIDWGLVSDVGMAADDDELIARLARTGLAAMSSEEALDMLESLLAEGPVHAVAASISFPTWLESGLAGGAGGRFVEVAEATGGAAVGGWPRARLVAVSAEERPGILAGALQAIVAEVIRADVEQVDVAVGLDELGVDSLMAVEIAARIGRVWGVEIPSMMLMRGRSIEALAEELVVQLMSSADCGAGEPVSDEPVDGDIVDHLSEQALDALLTEMME